MQSSPELDEKLLSYSRQFVKTDTGLTVMKPWLGAGESKFYPINQPLRRIVLTSTTHLHFFELLEAIDHIAGFVGTQYITSDVINNAVEDGMIMDVGTDGNINLELMMSLKPDAVIVYDMGNSAPMINKLASAGLNIIYCSDFLEESPLGRAEWLRFFGALIGKQDQADSIFNGIVANYENLQNLAKEVDAKPTVFTGIIYGDAWFLPAGQNWSAMFFKHAGAKYLWEDAPGNGWMQVGFEAVYEKASMADYWVGTSTATSLQELLVMDNRYNYFNSFRTQQVYNYHKRIGQNGGFDIFESGYARPDLVLADLIYIFHPNLLPSYETYYYDLLK